MSKNLTERFTEAVNRYERAVAGLEDADSRRRIAETELESAKVALGKVAIPADATPGESFNIWVGDRLLNVTKQANGCHVEWRKGGKAS